VKNNPNLVSNKEIFDWSNDKNKSEKQDYVPIYLNTQDKFLLNGRVHYNENNVSSQSNNSNKMRAHSLNTKILEWDSHGFTERQNNSIKRRDPNYSTEKHLK